MATIRSNPIFDAEAAATLLSDAITGLGTNEEAIIRCLVSHDNKQRQEIREKYQEKYGRDLVDDLKGDLGGNFEEAVEALMYDVNTMMAQQLYNATKGLGTNEAALVETLCGRSRDEIAEIKEAYRKKYDCELTDDVKSDTSGDIGKFLRAEVSGIRDQTQDVDLEKAAADAKDIVKAADEDYRGNRGDIFTWMLTRRNFNQLVEIFKEYKKQSGADIEEAIREEFDGDLRDAYLAIVGYIRDPGGFFAERLYRSMKGAGTSDSDLIRIIVSRAEVDLRDIAVSFKEKYGTSLVDFINDDCSGDYRSILVAMVGLS